MQLQPPASRPTRVGGGCSVAALGAVQFGVALFMSTWCGGWKQRSRHAGLTSTSVWTDDRAFRPILAAATAAGAEDSRAGLFHVLRMSLACSPLAALQTRVAFTVACRVPVSLAVGGKRLQSSLLDGAQDSCAITKRNEYVSNEGGSGGSYRAQKDKMAMERLAPARRSLVPAVAGMGSPHKSVNSIAQPCW